MTDETLGESPALAENALAGNESADAEKTAPDVPESAPVAKKDTSDAIEKMQKRIDKLTWERNEALRRENERLKREIEQVQRPEVKPPVNEGDDEAYNKALLDYIDKRAEEVLAKKLSKTEREAQDRANAARFETKQAEFIKSKPDYVEKVLENSTLPITEAMAEVIKESEFGPQLAYYLAENQEKAAAIARLPEKLQAKELGKIEAKLEAPVKPSVSKAPPPTPRLEASEPDVRVSVDSPESDKLSDAEWARRRKMQLSRRG